MGSQRERGEEKKGRAMILSPPPPPSSVSSVFSLCCLLRCPKISSLVSNPTEPGRGSIDKLVTLTHLEYSSPANL